MYWCIHIYVEYTYIHIYVEYTYMYMNTVDFPNYVLQSKKINEVSPLFEGKNHI